MLFMAVNPARARQTDKVQFGIMFFTVPDGIKKCLVFKKISGRYIAVNPRPFLNDYTAGAYCRMPNFRIAGFAPRQADHQSCRRQAERWEFVYQRIKVF